MRLLQRQIAGKEGHQQGGLGGAQGVDIDLQRVIRLDADEGEQALIERGVHTGQQAQLADILHRLVGGEIARGLRHIDLVLRPVQPRLAVAVRPVAKGGGDLAGAQRRLAEQRQQPNEDVGRVGRSVASLIRAMVDGIEVKAGVPVADRGADFAIVEGKAAPLLRPGLRQVRLTGRVQRIALQQRGGHIFRRQGVPSGLQIIEGHGGMLIHDRGALGHGAGEDHHQGEDEQHHQERDAALPIYHWPPPGVSKNRRVISPLFASVRVISSPCGSLCGRSQVSCQRPSA